MLHACLNTENSGNLTVFLDHLDVDAVFDPCFGQFLDFDDDFVQQKEAQRAQTKAELKIYNSNDNSLE